MASSGRPGQQEAGEGITPGIPPNPSTTAQPETVEGGDVSSDSPDNGEIYGGEVSRRAGPAAAAGPAKDPEESRSKLAGNLVYLLLVLIILHYCGLLLLEWNTKKETQALDNAFNATLPVVSGLVASAVTYYFTREQQQKK
jgi:hypothetical protein